MKKVLIIIFGFILLSGCGKQLQETAMNIEPTSSTKNINEPKKTKTKTNQTPTPIPTIDPRVKSPLTGLKIEKENAEKRPIAVVINNLYKALPQSGISQADIYYEVLAEAGITRIIAFFQDFTSEKIGTVRSTRHYFTDFALDNDAIYVHHGGSEEGYQFIKNYSIDDLDGMALEGSVFFRDQKRIKEKGLEHSSYTSAQRIKTAIDKYSIRKVHTDEFKPMFQFFEQESKLLDGELAKKIIVPFSDGQQSIFVFDPEKKIYFRFQGEDKHIDEENGEQLSVTNVIVQTVSMHVTDSVGRRDVNLVGEGTGYLFTNETYIPIKWKKTSHGSATKWYDTNDEILAINKGKTWICVFQDTGEIKIINE